MKCYALVLALTIVGRVMAAQRQFDPPDFNLYHDKATTLKLVEEIVARKPTIMKLEKKEKGDSGYNVTLPVVTLELSGLSSDYLNKIRIMLSFGEHGREIITTELGLKLLQCFESETHLLGCIPEERDFDRIRRLLDHVVFKIFPMENPVGRDMVEKGEFCERKNGRGVDINRNWDFDFGKKEEYYDPKEEYGGEHAFSEPETSILHETAFEFGPHVWIGFHSGTCALFMPYDHVGNLPHGKASQAQLNMLETLKEADLLPKCKVGSGGKNVGYVAHGTGTDYMYSVLNVPLACTWEVYGDHTVSQDDCYRMFNPATQKELQATLSMWIATFFHFLEIMSEHPDIPDFTGNSHVMTGESINHTSTSETELPSSVGTVTATKDPLRDQVQSFEGVHMQTTEYRTMSVTAPVMLGILPLLVGIAVACYFVKKRNSVRNSRVHIV